MTRAFAPPLLVAVLAAGCGGDNPDYDLEAIAASTEPLPASVLISPAAIRVGFVRAKLDGVERTWPLLVNAGFRVGSSWQWTATDEGGRGRIRLRGDARAEERFEIDARVSTDADRHVVGLVAPIRLRAKLPIAGESRMATFVPDPSQPPTLDEVELMPGDDLAVRGRFSGTLRYGDAPPRVVENGRFEARVRRRLP